MAELVDSTSAAEVPADDVIVFGGAKRNFAMGIAMFGAGFAAFVASLTATFFVRAIASVFIAWGLFFIYTDLLISTRRFELRPDTLTVRVPFRLWNRNKVWAWKDITRLEIVIHRRDIEAASAMLRIHHQYPGSLSLEREDRNYDPELAYLVVQRAKLRPDGAGHPVDYSSLPLGEDQIIAWKK